MRTVQILTLENVLVSMPVPWEDAGGEDGLRYAIRKAEFQRKLADMIEHADEVEGDAQYYCENGQETTRFSNDIRELSKIFTHLCDEADAARAKTGW